MDDVRKQVANLLPPIIESRVTGEATVLQIFEIQGKAKQVTKVAGCRVTNGIVDKSKKARIVRDGETVYEGMHKSFSTRFPLSLTVPTMQER